MTEAALYGTLFLALFFQVFALLTFLSKDAVSRRTKPGITSNFPKVAIIVPCWNEETTIQGTVQSLLQLDYPKDKLEIFLVNDGSTDNTPRVMDAYLNTPGIRVIHKENGGKHSAVNLGIQSTDAEYIGCLDADSFVHPGALKEIIPHFEDARVAAVTASMSVHNPRNPLERMQSAEYMIGIALRHILSAVNGLYVTPGPFSFYRKSTLEKIGSFRHGHQTEDMEMAMRIQKHGYRIENAPRAKVFTKAPKTVWGLIKQRTRWTSGFMRNAYDYRDLIGNPKYGVLGLLVMPLGVLAIVSGISLFALTVYQTIDNVLHSVKVQGDVPLSFALSLNHMDWFYVPITGIFLLGLIAIGIITATIIIGKKISETEFSVGTNMVWYIVLYSFIAPFWLLRSARDVTLSINRSWR